MEQIFLLNNMYSAIRLVNIQYSKIEQGWSYPNHRHSIFEFLYCASGQIEQWVNGRAYQLNAGDALIIKPGLVHHTSPVAADCIFFDFHFDLELKEVYTLFSLMIEPLISGRDPGREEQPIIRWIERFIAEFGDLLPQPEQQDTETDYLQSVHNTVRLLQMHARVLEFVILLAEYILSSKSPETSSGAYASIPQITLAQNAAYQIETHAAAGVQIHEIAARLNVNRSYLSSCFRKVYGLPPSLYLSQVRIREAKKLLQETETSIEEIAARLSFSSSGHFSRSFKSQTELSPLHYRNHVRNQSKPTVPGTVK